jgi:hypothetical protein
MGLNRGYRSLANQVSRQFNIMSGGIGERFARKRLGLRGSDSPTGIMAEFARVAAIQRWALSARSFKRACFFNPVEFDGIRANGGPAFRFARLARV